MPRPTCGLGTPSLSTLRRRLGDDSQNLDRVPSRLLDSGGQDGGTEGAVGRVNAPCVPLFCHTMMIWPMASVGLQPQPHTQGKAGKETPPLPPLQTSNECAIVPPRKWAPGPLPFLGACRITYVPGEIHRESPCGSASGETSPSPTTVRRRVRPVPMPFPHKPFAATRLRRGSLRFSYNCTTVHHSSLTVRGGFVTPL